MYFVLEYIFEKSYFKNNTLIFGASIPKSGIMKGWGKAVYSGANAYFSYANDQKLLNKTKIKFITYDDKYVPETTIKNTLHIIDKNYFAFFGFVGTPTVKKILPTLKNSNIPFIAPFTGASFLRDSKNIINFRSSYKQEIDYMVEYLSKKHSINRFAIFYQNDDYGEEGYVSLINSLQKRDLQLVGEGTYKRNTLSIQHAFHEIKNSKPEAILMVGAYRANALFIKTAKKSKIFKDTIFCNLSFGDANQMIKELDNTKNVLFSEVVPNFDDSSEHIILEYKNLMRKYYPNQPLGFISLEAFLAAKTVVSALKNIKTNITREAFLKEIKNLPNNTLNGIYTEFKNNQLHNKVYLFKYENHKFIEVSNEY